MTGDRATRVWMMACAVCMLQGCLEWESAGDVEGGEPRVPALHGMPPASLPPVSTFDPHDPSERCRMACQRYQDCFGSQVDPESCQYNCTNEGWIEDSDDLGCFVWSACSQLWLCYE